MQVRSISTGKVPKVISENDQILEKWNQLKNSFKDKELLSRDVSNIKLKVTASDPVLDRCSEPVNDRQSDASADPEDTDDNDYNPFEESQNPQTPEIKHNVRLIVTPRSKGCGDVSPQVTIDSSSLNRCFEQQQPVDIPRLDVDELQISNLELSRRDSCASIKTNAVGKKVKKTDKLKKKKVVDRLSVYGKPVVNNSLNKVMRKKRHGRLKNSNSKSTISTTLPSKKNERRKLKRQKSKCD